MSQESKFIKAQSVLTATIKSLVADGADCYTKLGNGAFIRVIPRTAFLVYREGQPPSTPRAKHAWANELETFRRYAALAGVQLCANPVTAGGGGDKMKEKPILFSSEMVRAILEGRKTQTRRDSVNLTRYLFYTMMIM